MAPYLSATAIRSQVSDLASATVITDDAVDAYVAQFEALAERYRGCAFTTRTAIDTTSGCRGRLVVLRHPMVQAITSATIDGEAWTGTTALDAEAGIVTLSAIPGGDLDLAYTHGPATPPAAVLRACRLFVWREAMADLNPNSGNAYVTAQSDVAGNQFVQRESTADYAAGRPTGWLDVDRILNQLPDYRTPAVA